MPEESEKFNNDKIQTDSHVHNLHSSGKHMSRAYFFNFLSVYGVIPINLILTMLITRFLTPNNWGIFIYAIVLIGGARMVLIFIPPAIESVLLYQIPELIVKNEMSRIKGFILYFLKIKGFASTLIMIGYIIVACFFLDDPNTHIYAILTIILSPIILIQEIVGIFLHLTNTLKKFSINTVLRIQEKILLLGGYLYFYFIDWTEYEKLIGISILMVFVYLCFLPSLIIIFLKDFRNFPTQNITRIDIKSSILFGTAFSFIGSASIAYDQVYNGVTNLLGFPKFVAYNNICQNLSNEAITGFSPPLGPVLGDLEKSNKRDQMLILFTKTLNISNILIGFMLGILFFASEIYILIIYPPDYLEVVVALKIFVIVIYFVNILNSYRALYSITNNIKIMWQMELFMNFVASILAILGMYFFDYLGIITSRVIGFAFGSLLFWYCGVYKIKAFKISGWIIYRHIFFITLILLLTTLLGKILANYLVTDVSLQWIINTLNTSLSFINSYNFTTQMRIILQSIINLLLFSLLYILYIILFRAITKQDIEQIEKLNLRIPFKNKIYPILKKFLRS